MVHNELPKILKSFPTHYISDRESKEIAKYLIEHFDMKLKPKPDLKPVEEVISLVYEPPVAKDSVDIGSAPEMF